MLYEAVLNGGTETVTFETWVIPQHYMTILIDTGPGGRLKVGSLSTSLPTHENFTLFNTRVAQKVMPHVFFLGNYLFRKYEIHAHYNWTFPLHMLFFHIISVCVYGLKPA